MTHPIIKTDNYILITSDELVEKNYGYSPKSNEIFYYTKDFYGKGHESLVNIIAHLPLNNSPILEGVPLLPPIHNKEDDLAEKEFPHLYQPMKGLDTTLLLREGFVTGYNKAKEKYKFTEEDMKKALSEAFKASQEGYQITSDEIISSLSQPKLPVGFKCAMETSRVPYGDDGWKTVETGYKIINGVMQGEWIFE